MVVSGPHEFRSSPIGCQLQSDPLTASPGSPTSLARVSFDAEPVLDHGLGLRGSFVVFIHDLPRGRADDGGRDRSTFHSKKLTVVMDQHCAGRTHGGDGSLIRIRTD